MRAGRTVVGRPSIGHDNMMLKVLVIQTANALSDERTRFLINDRLNHAQGGPLRSGG